MLFLIVAIVLALIIFSVLRKIAAPLILLVLALMAWNHVKDARISSVWGDPGLGYERVENPNGTHYWKQKPTQ
jgi:hypothetical protein